jgi:hypothetical protein
MIIPIAALCAGLAIGFAFGFVQQAARLRNEKRQQSGLLTSGWAVMPGSGMRIAFFMIALVLIQIVCPLLFRPAIQWWVSGGVVAGYGFTLYRQLRERLSRKS